MAVTLGFDALLARTKGKRLGVASTPAGWLPHAAAAIADFLVSEADVRAFLALEHGLRGELQDGVQFDSYTDARSGLPVYSCYGRNNSFPAAALADVDAVVFHAQDVTHRAYTYKSVMVRTIDACARNGIEVIVLDRPTPLAHFGVCGPVARQFFSEALPVLPASTLGELARRHVRQQAVDVDLTIVPVIGWSRQQTWTETGLPWVPPSPNLPTLLSTYCYACTGMVQHTNASEARGTCNPFEYVGAPYVDARALTARLNDAHLPGVCFREVHFLPNFNKFSGKTCAGVHLIITDCRALDPMRTGMTILRELAHLHPDEFRLLDYFRNWLDGQPWNLERLTGDLDALLDDWRRQAEAFRQDLADDWIYPER